MDQIKAVIWDFFMSILPVFLSVTGSYLIYLTRKLTEKAKAEADKIADEKLRDILGEAIYFVRITAENVVTSLEQTAAESIRKGILTGRNNREDLLELADQALNRIKETVGAETLNTLENAGININGLITDLIETNVYKLKHKRAEGNG